MSTDKRTIEVILTAKDSGYSSTLENAGKKTKKTNEEVAKISPLAAAAAGKLGTVAMGLAGVGIAAAGFLTLATSKTMAFDKEMSRAFAAVRGTQDDTVEGYERMRKAALEAGATSVYTSNQAAQAMTELIKAGRSASDVVGGELDAALDLAASDGLDLAYAAELMASGMTMFERTGADAAQVADTLAAGAGLAAGGVGDLGEALKYAGSGAANSNMTIQETVGLLASLANNGMKGSMAGTALTGILRNLKTPTAEAKKQLQEINLEVYDAQGNFKGLTPMLEELAGRLDGMSEKDRDRVLSNIFDVRALNAAIPLLRDANTHLADGTTELDRMQSEVGQTGYAAGQAATMLDNLAGDWEHLTGAMETAFITSQDGFTDMARNTVQGITAIVRAYNELPAPIKNATTIATVGLSGIALAGAGMIKAAEYGKRLRDSLVAVGIEGRKATRLVKGVGAAGAGIGIALAVGLAVFSHFAEKAQESKDRVAELAKTFNVVNGNAQMTDSTLKSILDTLRAYGSGSWFDGKTLGEYLDMSGVSTADTVKAITGTDEAFQKFMDNSRESIRQWRTENPGGWFEPDAAGLQAQFKDAMEEQRNEYKRSQEEAEALKAANNSLGTSYTNLGDAQRDATQTFDPLEAGTSAVAEEVKAAKDAVKAYIEALYGLRDAQSGLIGSESSMEAAIDNAKTAIEEKNLATLKGKDINDLNNATVRQANDALRGIADQARNYGAALLEQGYSQEWANSQSELAAAQIMAQAREWGLAEDDALDFAEAVTGIPQNRIVEITVKGARAAEAVLEDVETGVYDIPEEKLINVTAAIATGDMKKVQEELKGLPEEQQLDILTTLKDEGFKGADKEWEKLNKKLAKKLNINVDGKNAKQIAREVKAELDKLKDKTVNIRANYISKEYGSRPGAATGGKLSGPGTGTSDSIPINVSDGEWVIRQRSAAYYGDGIMSRINSGSIPRERLGYASGGKVSAAARAELLRDLRVEIRRGNISESVLSGSGLNVIDTLLRWAQDTNLSSTSRRGLASAATKYEAQLTKLYDQLDAANEKVSQLEQVYDSIKSTLGRFDLGTSLASTFTENRDSLGNVWYTENKATAASIASAATAKAAQLKAFAGKLSELQKAGASAAVLNDIASLGAEQGIPVADAFLQDKSSIATMNQAYADIEAFSGAAAQAVTEASYAGGLAAAQGFQEGLEKQLGTIGSALANELAKALGYRVSGTSLVKRAGGGPTYAGQPYLVGEKSAEIRVDSTNGYILNREQAIAALRGGNQAQTNIVQYNINGMQINPTFEETAVLVGFARKAEQYRNARGRH